MTALSGEAALFTLFTLFPPGCEYCSAIPQSRRAILTALYWDDGVFGKMFVPNGAPEVDRVPNYPTMLQGLSAFLKYHWVGA